MTFYTTNEFYSGLKIILDDEPCEIIENEFVKPGKGQAFNRIRLRKLISGKVIEKTLRSGESVEAADVMDANLIYLYNDKILWYFMNRKNFEQLTANIDVIGSSAKWLVEQSECTLTLWNNQPITVTPPNFVELEIVHTAPSFKGDTVGANGKQAILTTGAIVKVPLFLQIGEIIKVDTRTSQYVSRVKNTIRKK